jgi:hypothetical protein
VIRHRHSRLTVDRVAAELWLVHYRHEYRSACGPAHGFADCAAHVRRGFRGLALHVLARGYRSGAK